MGSVISPDLDSVGAIFRPGHGQHIEMRCDRAAGTVHSVVARVGTVGPVASPRVVLIAKTPGVVNILYRVISATQLSAVSCLGGIKERQERADARRARLRHIQAERADRHRT